MNVFSCSSGFSEGMLDCEPDPELTLQSSLWATDIRQSRAWLRLSKFVSGTTSEYSLRALGMRPINV